MVSGGILGSVAVPGFSAGHDPETRAVCNAVNDFVEAGMPLGVIETLETGEPLTAYTYFPVKDGKRIGVIEGINRISRPGRRIFAGKDNIPKVCGGYGISILSTNQGILTGHQCRMRGVGGEVLCEVW